MTEGFLVFVAVVVALGIAAVSFSVGRASVADNCDVYGKAKIEQRVYVCSKQ